MAHIPRLMAAGAPSSLSGGRPAAGTRNIANAEPAAVEELSPQFGLFFDDANLRFQDYGYLPGQRQREPTLLPSASRFDTTTQSFAEIYELAQMSGDVGGPIMSESGPVFARPVAQAIGIYETNARVVAGENNQLGESLSIQL
jgi:hypothetical protein